MTEQDSLKFWLEFTQRVDNWHKNRSEVFTDKREATYQFALEVLDADPAKAREFINRPNIKWGIIKCFSHRGKLITCKVCGNKDYTSYWCSPCIHRSRFCCECCILMGIPYYGGDMAVIGTRKCPYCGAEFTDMVNLGSSVNLGLGVVRSKTDKATKTKCPKCQKEV